ncbi:MAG: glycosyltransferase family 4 protein [Patescibacteria group bacterium]
MSTNSKKRVLVLSTAYYPFVGGAEVAITEITRRLGESFDFDLVTAKIRKDLPDFEKIGNVNVYRVGMGSETIDKLLLPFRGAILINKLNYKNNYFLIWGMMVTFGTGAGYIFNIFRFFTRKRRIPIILTLQEGDSENHLTYRWFGLIALSWKLSLRLTHIVTGISTFLIQRAKKNGFTGEAVLVPNGVDLEVFTKQFTVEEKAEMALMLNKKADEVFLVTTGRLTHKNAVDDVVRALTHLPKRVVFMVIGKGEEGHKLQALAKELGVSDRVRFLGFLDYKDIPRYFSVCDIFIRPSRSEGFGNSFIEAMASGLPVVATPVGGIPDFIDDKETGIFCSPDNPQSVARAVNTLLNDKDLYIKLSNNGKRVASTKYGWDKITEGMKDVFNKLTVNANEF